MKLCKPKAFDQPIDPPYRGLMVTRTGTVVFISDGERFRVSVPSIGQIPYKLIAPVSMICGNGSGKQGDGSLEGGTNFPIDDIYGLR